MLKNFKAFIAKEKLFSPDDRVLLAVSGGIDSVFMCDLFHRAGFSFGIAHCNFGLRGKESDEDEIFVEKLAKNYKVPFYCKKFSTKKVAKDKKLSIQMAARDLRYEWFEEIRSKENYKFIATAHHLDDQIETFFINLQRSTGIAGLHGILPIQKTLVRPLLFTYRENIVSYARKHKLEYREDSSNAENKYLRNKIRHEIIPVFRELNQAFPQVLTENIHRIREAELIFRNSIEEVRKKLIKEDKEGLHISVNELNKLTPAGIYAFELLSPFGFNESVIGDLLQSREEFSGKVFYSQTHRLIMNRDEIILNAIPDKKDTLLKNSKIIIPEERKEIRKPIHLKFERKEGGKGFGIDTSENTANLDLRNIKYPLILRRWEKGDAFYPLGMNKKKKLSDYFIDQKLSIPAKENIWLLCSGPNILWIAGQRIDHRFRITPKTKEVLQVRWEVEK
ncbi:MAG: tRNA lysidine(34) synthetase TilS [Bacteroidales bacterium]|jgi:tRNA(Ile)-lysidine synthase